MGILDNLTKNPSLLALAALGIGLFIFRDKISGFFSDITGGAAGTASIAETGGILAKNLTSNLTLTPLPEDPIFGEQGIFAKLSESISNFKLPSFEFPSFPTASAEPEGTGGDFTDTGMAEARARQNIEQEVIRFPTEGFVVADPVTIPFAVANVEETQAGFQERSQAFAETFPDIAFSTSLTDDITFGRQLSRNQEDFENVLAAEAARSESIFAGLFGNVQNPNF